jgi:single-strand DNA-binding protein
MVRDPLVKETSRGTALCTFSIAANRSFKNAEGNFDKEVSYFDVETWGNLAKTCTTNGGKGRGVRVIGRLKQNRWTGSDGKNYSKVSIVAEHVEFKSIFNKSQAQHDAEQQGANMEKDLEFNLVEEKEAIPAF